MAARRAYVDTCAWVRSSAKGSSWARAKNAFSWAYLFAFVSIGSIGVLSPKRFGSPGAAAFRGGWATALLIVAVTSGLVYLMTKVGFVAWCLARMVEPFRRSLEEEPAHEGAVGNLARCPQMLRSRFALAWVWGPLGLAVLAAIFVSASAYFLVDAILARFQVGWGQPAFAVGHAIAGFAFFVGAAPRLRTWRLAVSVRRTVPRL